MLFETFQIVINSRNPGCLLIRWRQPYLIRNIMLDRYHVMPPDRSPIGIKESGREKAFLTIPFQEDSLTRFRMAQPTVRLWRVTDATIFLGTEE